MRQVKYYYIRDNIKSDPDGLGRPIITVCLIEDHDIIARGLAICSDLDQPCKKVGRAIALGRACYALASTKSGLEVKRKKLPWLNIVLLNTFGVGSLKSCFNPSLTPYERKLFRITGNYGPENLSF